MHIPDGFLDVPTLVATNGISLGVLVAAIGRVNRTLTPARIPLIGLSAAFVFTVQLLSFPVLGGTSVHITGAVLIAILLGPMTGMVIMTSALLLQAVLFQHGGILTLGANVLNMGVTGCLAGYFIYRSFNRLRFPGAGMAAFVASVLSATVCAIELGLSGTVPLATGMISMITAYLLEGVIEAMVTVSVIGIIAKTRPDLLELEKI